MREWPCVTGTSMLILCGDYNVHVNKPDESETRKFMTIIESAGLVQHVTEKTHDKGNTLDLVITDENSSLIKNCTVSDFLSDHAVIVFELNMKKPPKCRKTIKFRRNKNIDIDALKMLVASNLETMGEPKCLTELVEGYTLALAKAYNELAPTETKSVIIRAPTPWSNNDIRADKSLRRKLERKWKKSGLQSDWENYKAFRNTFNNKLNDLRNKHYSDIIENNKDDPKQLFKVINQSLHRKQNSPLHEGVSNSDLAEEFGNYFSEKIEKNRASIDDQGKDHIQSRHDTDVNVDDTVKFTEFKTVTEEELIKTINDFSNK